MIKIKDKNVYLVVSGKGGTGKTTVSVNLAVTLQNNLLKKVLLIDADFILPSVNILMNVIPTHNLNKVLSNAINVRNIKKSITHTRYGVDILAYTTDTENRVNINLQKMREFCKTVITLDYDIVIFDCGAGINTIMQVLARYSTECLTITLPDPTALINSQKTIIALNRRNPTLKYNLIVNKIEDEKVTIENVASFVQLVRSKYNINLDFLDVIPYDKVVMSSGINQQPFILQSKSSASDAVERIAHSLQGLRFKKQVDFINYLFNTIKNVLKIK